MSWLCFILMVTSAVFAAQPTRMLPSVQWQKTFVKKDIEDKTKDVLSKVLRPEDYIVNARIDLATPQMPDFSKKKPANDAAAATNPNTHLNKIKASNSAPENDPFGYIVFHKMGLEVPLIEDFDDAPSSISGTTSPKMDAGYDFENIWKYNNALDIFNNIDHVAINIQVTDEVTEEARIQLEKIVNQVSYDLPSIQPDIKFEYINFNLTKIAKNLPLVTPKEAPKPEVPLAQKVLDFLEKFHLPLTIISSVFILGLFGLVLMKKYKQILDEASQASQTLTMEDAAKKDDSEPGTIAAAADNLTSPIAQSEIARFIAYLEQAPRECLSMVRDWIRNPETPQILGLSLLVENLPNESLTTLVMMMTEEDRGRLRSLVQTGLKSEDVIKAKEFIGGKVRDEILKGEIIDDPELKEMLLALSPKKAALLVTEQPEVISLLFSRLTAKFLGLILEQLPEERKSFIINEALGQKDFSDMKTFKTLLSRYAEIELFSPALEKIKMILPESSRNTEETLYHAIAKYGNSQSVKACAMRSFPYQLVTSLPGELLKEVFLQYDPMKRVEYLETLDSGEKELFINAFAPVGSKARDIYELDYERAFADDQAIANIEANVEFISKDFIVHVRNYLKKNAHLKTRVDNIISKWAEERCAQFSSHNELKIVA